MDSETIVGIILGAVFIGLNSFFVLSEFSLVKVRKSKLEEFIKEGRSNARLALQMSNSLDTYLSATQLGITLASLALGWIGQPALGSLIQWIMSALGLGPIDGFGVDALALAFAFVLITLLHVVLGELIPKSIAISKTEKVVLWISRPLHLFWVVFFPVIRTFDFVAATGIKLMGIKRPRESDLAHSEEEIKIIVNESLKGGVLDSMESEIIQNAIDFSDTVAKEVMTPRKDMVVLNARKSLEENLAIIRESKFTRFAYVDGSKDNVLGMLHIRDVLQAFLNNKTIDLGANLRKFIIVPENCSISNILNMMNKDQVYAALVMDEYGGTAGFVTLEDIVGEVFDEFEEEEKDTDYKECEDGSYEFSGRYELEDMEEILGVSFGDEQVTIGGYVFNLFAYLPEVGESIADENCVFEVLGVSNSAITKIRITLKENVSSGLN